MNTFVQEVNMLNNSQQYFKYKKRTFECVSFIMTINITKSTTQFQSVLI